MSRKVFVADKNPFCAFSRPPWRGSRRFITSLVPEIVGVPFAAGRAPYLAWIGEGTGPVSRTSALRPGTDPSATGWRVSPPRCPRLPPRGPIYTSAAPPARLCVTPCAAFVQHRQIEGGIPIALLRPPW